jgi:hypothetical protein
MSRRLLAGLAVAAVVLAGSGVAIADTTTTAVACTSDGTTLSCPLPAPVTSTETVTTTADPVTTTVTVTADTPTPTTPTTAPTSTPTGCAGSANDAAGADPFGGCWPGPGNTGVPAGTALTVVTGNQTYSVANTVVSGKDIRGCVNVTAPGVTIKNSRVTCTSSYAVDYYVSSGARLTLQDVTITCGNQPGTGVGEVRVTVIRADISGCENGLDADSDITVQDSYIHDLYQSSVAHTDGIQSAIGSNLILDHNVWFANDGTSAMIINNNPSGPHSSNTTISRNLVAGGAFTVYCPRVSTTNYKVVNNVFSRKFYPKVGLYGPSSDCADEQVSGNTLDNGAALTLN